MMRFRFGPSFMAAIFMAGVTPQAAQSASNNLPVANPIIKEIDVDQAQALLTKLNFSVVRLPDQGDGMPSFAATTDGGAQFLVSLFSCENETEGAGCKAVALYTAQSNAGLAYDDINEFNGVARVTKAVNVSADKMVVFGLQRFLQGGIGERNLVFEIALFLTDMQDYTDLRAERVSVNYRRLSEGSMKTDNLLSSAHAGPNDLLEGISVSAAVGAAINNTRHSTFDHKLPE